MSIEIIKAAHNIEADLARLAASLRDEDLRERVLTAQANWRDVAYAISSTVCGVAMKNLEEPAKKRGRPRKTDNDPARLPNHEESLRATDGGITNDNAAQL